MKGKKKSAQKTEDQGLPPTVTCSYLGDNPELQGSQWQVPRTLLYPVKGTKPTMTATAWIESKAREIAEKQAAVEEQEQRDQAVLEARMNEQRVAEQEAARLEKEAADNQRRAELKTELKDDIGYLANTNIQAAGAIKGEVLIFRDERRKWGEVLAQENTERQQALQEMRELKAENDEKHQQLLTGEGSNSLAIYKQKKSIDKLTKEIEDLKAENRRLWQRLNR